MILRRADQNASLYPHFLLKAKHLANSLILGFHGRKEIGIGENFWQFKPYVDGESPKKIDWRQTAKRETTFIQEKEWEAAQKILFVPDFTPSMDYRSLRRLDTKKERAILIITTLAYIFQKSGELFSVQGAPLKFLNSNEQIEKMAKVLIDDKNGLKAPVKASRAIPIFIGDFFKPIDEVKKQILSFMNNNQDAFVVQVLDPAEVEFSFKGHVLLSDQDHNKIEIQKAQNLREEYLKRFEAHQKQIKDLCINLNISYFMHRTDENVHDFLTDFMKRNSA